MAIFTVPYKAMWLVLIFWASYSDCDPYVVQNIEIARFFLIRSVKDGISQQGLRPPLFPNVCL